MQKPGPPGYHTGRLFAVRGTVIAVAKTAGVRRHVEFAHGLDGENRMGGGRSKGLRGMRGVGVGTRDAAGGNVKGGR